MLSEKLIQVHWPKSYGSCGALVTSLVAAAEERRVWNFPLLKIGPSCGSSHCCGSQHPSWYHHLPTEAAHSSWSAILYAVSFLSPDERTLSYHAAFMLTTLHSLSLGYSDHPQRRNHTAYSLFPQPLAATGLLFLWPFLYWLFIQM